MTQLHPNLNSMPTEESQSIQPEPSEKTYFHRFCPCLHYSVLQPYFDMSTQDIKQRVIASLMPLNQKFYMEYEKKPDLYGPFWLIWTLVVVLTISGNLSRYFEYDDPESFTYTFSIVPVSITVLLLAVLGVPIALRIVIKLFGHAEPTVPLLHGIGIYCYSFSSFVITSLLCGAIPVNFVQWLLIFYSAATSLTFIISTYWAELSNTLESRRRMFVIAGLCGVQLVLLLIFKLYFFKHVSPHHVE